MTDQGEMRLADAAADVIQPFSQAELRIAQARLKEIGREHETIATLMARESALKDLLLAAFSLSPYLRDLALREGAVLSQALDVPLQPLLAGLIAEARSAWRGQEGETAPAEAEVMARLRSVKRRMSLLLALADLGHVASGRDTTLWLSGLADAATAAAIDHLLLAADAAGKLALKDRQNPSEGSGLIVLGMGKLGAGELNYSSDIDLVVFFDPQAEILTVPEDASETYSRMMRRLVRILQERTGDGYVFRTDLRLRPDPGSTPLAVSVDAALIYYEGRGQNWERAAYIKARPIAGDLSAGAAFLRELAPFVYRKYLDYAAIADIHSIKRQIHAHRGHAAIAVKGHNVKLGRGGIREIEFFVQTQQLIAGGRMPELRLRGTEEGLQALQKAGWIDEPTARELIACYWFLRDVEHRLQMVHDEQTHMLPSKDAELRRIALMAGFADSGSFSQEVEATLRIVERRYARLFERESGLSSESGNLVFTGQKDDPETLATLRTMGYERPEDIARVVRTWHYGRYRATQSVEARERLTELMPRLLRAFGESRRADEALLRFDSFLSGLPAGIQLFSLLGNNPALLDLMVTIMAAAPRLAAIIAARPHVFDGMLDPQLLAELPTRDYLAERLGAFLGPARHYEEMLDRLRIFAAEQRFLIGIRLLTGAIGAVAAGEAFTDLAELVIAASLDAVRAEMEEAHGSFPGGAVALVGLGKLGSRELTAGSDVDLILLYDHDAEASESLGPKPLDAPRYFGRLTQRLIAALSAPTAEGVLYEVDMRLRPSGNKGPVATRITAFAKYQREEAETWEHMALSRSRILCGDQALVEAAGSLIAGIIATPRDAKAVAVEVSDMRALIEAEKPPRDPWDLKLIPGGLIDIEFIAQYLALVTGGTEGAPPAWAGRTTAETLQALGEQGLSPDDQAQCLAALDFYGALSQVIRLCLDGPFDAKHVPAGLVDLVCQAAGMPDIARVEAEVARHARHVRGIFDRVLRQA